MRPERARIALGALAVGAPHLLGGAFAWGTAALAIGGCMVLAGAVFETRRARDRPREAEPLVALLAVMLAATMAHALPMHTSLGSFLAPEALAHARQTALGLGLAAPRWVPLSLDPGGTHERILFGVALFTAFCAARLTGSSTRSTQLLHAVAASAILIAASDILHRALGATQVYGLYTPAMPEVRGPLLNENNLAGFLALGFPVCLGLALRATAGPRWAWLLGAAVVGATSLLAGSRGGTAALAIGGLLFAGLYLTRFAGITAARESHGRGRGSSAGRWPLRFSGIAIAAAAMAFAVMLANLGAENFVDTDYGNLTKFDLYRAEWQLLTASPRTALFGVGRGAFAPAFAQVSPWFARAREAESLPLQYAIEFGMPIALLLLGGATLRILGAIRSCRSPAHLGGLVGVTAIALQNLVDFSLELSGVALPAVVCLAASVGRSPRSFRGWSAGPALWRASFAGLIVCVCLLAFFVRSAVTNDRLLVELQLKKDFTLRDSSAFWGRFPAAVSAHPADATFALLAASQAVMDRREDASFWLNRASQLAPAGSLPHLWAARWHALAGRGEKALDELSTAATLDPRKTVKGLCPWIARAPSSRTVLRLAPKQGEGRIDILDAGARCLASVPAEAEQVDRVLLRVQPGHVPARLRMAERNLALKHWNEVIKQAREIAQQVPSLAEPRLLEAKALLGLGRAAEAVQTLLAALPRTDDRPAVLTLLARARTNSADAEGMRQAIEQLRMTAAGVPESLAEAAALLSECEAKLGNDARALKAMREAYALSANMKYLASAARIAMKLGQTDFALSAWEQLCSPANPPYCTARDSLRARRRASP